jgi:type IX secretion system PorP/SprF family membrane protein
MKKSINTLLASLLFVSAIAQDAHLSQFYEANIIRNPALTGIFSGDYKINLQYRNQWSALSVPFQTMLFSAESKKSIGKESGDFISYGLFTTIDKAGTINMSNSQFYGMLNYNKLLEEYHYTYLSFGFSGGFIQRSFNASRMIFDNQYQNGTITTGIGETIASNTLRHYDIGSGLSLNGAMGYENKANYYIGVGLYHINKPDETFRNESFVKLNRKWSIHAGFKSNIGNNLSITALVNYTKQNPFEELVFGAFLNVKPISVINSKNHVILSIGAFNRVNDAYIGVVKCDFKNYAIAISYDATSSALKNYNQGFGAYELSINWRGFYKFSNNRAMMRCPRFEDLFEPDAY